jgi:hypothetical protein
MVSALQLVGVAVVPLNVNVLVPCVAPKPEPAIVTEAPTAPEVGERLVMLGPVACVVDAMRDTEKIATRRIGFQLRTRIKISLPRPTIRGQSNEFCSQRFMVAVIDSGR